MNKHKLFHILYVHRGSPTCYPFVEALNSIEVVFQKDANVIESWKKYLDALDPNLSLNASDRQLLARVNLISQIGKSLGYHDLNQTDIMLYYYPQGHADKLADDVALMRDVREYLKTGIEVQHHLIAYYERLTHAQKDSATT